MKSKTLLIIMALSAALALGLFATGCGGGDDKSDTPAKVATTEVNEDDEADPPKSEPDADLIREVTFKACVQSAEDSGVTEDMADEYCQCAADGVMDELSVDQLEEIGAAGLSGDVDLPPEVEGKLADIILNCVDQFLEE
jgi:hypothetical protein